MSIVIVVAVVIAAVVLPFVLAKARWVSAVLGVGVAIAMLGQMGDTTDDDHGLQGLANGMLALGALGVLILAVIAYGIAGYVRSPAKPEPTPPGAPDESLDEATVVSERGV